MASRYSRRTTTSTTKPGTSDRNQQIIKTLLSDPANKTCADCKTTQHPRWASWNIGVFLCIRCSGIHRGMGTHISKVRSVDLDSWTDMHLENLIKWGNRRANKYWEGKLPANYIPDDSKITNFIKTKYDMKRWVLSPSLPDPSSLDESDDTTPLAEVQKKLSKDQSAKSASASAAKPTKPAPLIADLLDDGPLVGQPTAALSTPSSHSPSGSRSVSGLQTKPMPAIPASNSATSTGKPPAPPKIDTNKQQQQQDSLLGLDFALSPTSASSTASTPGGMGGSSLDRPPSASPVGSGMQRPDLKKSILSLYASSNPNPALQRSQQPQPQQSQPIPPQNSLFESLTMGTQNLSLNEQPVSNASAAQNQNDLFSLGSFGQPSSQWQPSVSQSSSQPSEFQSISQPAPSSSTAQTNGLFGDIGSSANAWASTPTHHQPSQRKASVDEWESFSSAPPQKPVAGSGMDDELFGNVWK